MRVLGLDIGDVRIGVAVSDPLQTIAQALDYIKRIGYSKDIAQIQNYADQYQTKTLVLGLPKLLSGEEGEQARKTRAFAMELEKEGFEVLFQDERLSSKSAESILIENNMRRENRKHSVDKIAAAIILQTWLDKQKK